VDHSTPLPPAQPWRAAAIVAAAVATVELFILVLIGIAFATRFFAGEVDQAATSALPQAPAVEQPAPVQPAPVAETKKKEEPAAKAVLARGETSVIVLNGNGISGAAATTADRVRTRGYLIAGSANAPRSDFQQSVIMFRPGFEREARRLSADVGIRRVGPLDGLSKRDLQGAHLALIIGG
jgi:LytR cell envelope-related transcriptional attenuator